MPADNEARFMARALELARQGVALASPNPMVGAVLVRHGGIVGEGFHTYDGRKHAEIIALENAREAARGSTLFINLEPCCHTGRTEPCTGALIAAGVKRVVAAMADPNPRVSGCGIRQLRKAGINVEVGQGEAEGRKLNEAFAVWIRRGVPLVTQKSAVTLDGKIALPDGNREKGSVTWITSELSRAEVQQMRHASDALLTSIGTVLADDPRMTDRTGLPRRRPLLRVVLDSKLRLPLESKLVKSAARDLLVFTAQGPNSSRARALRNAGVEVVSMKARRDKIKTRHGRGAGLDLRAVAQELGRREITSALLEAGGRLNASALRAGIVDKLVLFFAPRIFGEGVPAIDGAVKLPPLRNLSFWHCGPDLVVEGYLRDVYRNR